MRRPVSAALPALGLVGALTLSGCGTGLQAQTYKEQANRAFDNATVDGSGIQLRNFEVSAPATGTTISPDDVAVLTGGIVNTGTEADSLTGVTTDAAGSVQLQVDGKDVTSVPVPAGDDAGTTWAAVLSDLKAPLVSGTYVTVTLTFERAGKTQTLSVPVASGNTGLGDREPAQDPYGGGE